MDDSSETQRRDFLRSLIDTGGLGLEIGPSFRPLLPKAEGYQVEIVDFAEAAKLREIYSDHDVSKIEEVDFISNGGSLVDLIGQTGRYDFIVASHVIEHVPNLVGFLEDCERLLKPKGSILLAVPDKRFCFDVLRPISTPGQALQAHHEKRTRHPPGVVFDHNNIVAKNHSVVWLEPTLDDLFPIFPEGTDIVEYRKSMSSPEYIDCHGWQFTPHSFVYMLKTLRRVGAIHLGIEALHKHVPATCNFHEFYAVLSHSAPECGATDIDLQRMIERELRVVQVDTAVTPDAGDQGELMDRIAELEVKIDRMERSKSWRFTAPLRQLRSALAARSRAHGRNIL